MRVEDTTMIQVALPATNVIAMVDAPYDWPSPGVPLRLESLLTRKGDSAFQDEVAEMVLVRLRSGYFSVTKSFGVLRRRSGGATALCLAALSEYLE